MGDIENAVILLFVINDAMTLMQVQQQYDRILSGQNRALSEVAVVEREIFRVEIGLAQLAA